MRLKRESKLSGDGRPHPRCGAIGAGRRGLILLMVAGFVWGCSQSEESQMTTGQTVRQEQLGAARGLGDYRLVEMPEEARRNLVEADPKAPGAAAYGASISGR